MTRPRSATPTDPNGPYRYYYSQLLKKLQRGNRAIAFKTDPKQADEDVSLDAVCEKLVFWGSPNRVADQILAFREEVGDFGTLLMAGKDWKDRDARPAQHGPARREGDAAGECRDREAAGGGVAVTASVRSIASPLEGEGISQSHEKNG